jgi:hypothetical protein
MRRWLEQAHSPDMTFYPSERAQLVPTVTFDPA